MLEHELLISWFNAKSVAILKNKQNYCYIIITTTKIPYSMFTLEEVLDIAAQAKNHEITLYAAADTWFYWINKAANLNTPHSSLASDNEGLGANVNNATPDLNNEELSRVITYFEPVEPPSVNINPTCTRIYFENVSINPPQLFEKIANKTVFIVHTKNSEHCRTGPFIFNKLAHFFEALFTFNSPSEINSAGGGTVCTVAYLDVYTTAGSHI